MLSRAEQDQREQFEDGLFSDSLHDAASPLESSRMQLSLCAGYTPLLPMHIIRLTTPTAATNVAAVLKPVLCIDRPRRCAALLALVTSALLAACAAPAKPAANAAAPAAANANQSTVTIECPVRGAFGNGPTYYSQYYEDYILG